MGKISMKKKTGGRYEGDEGKSQFELIPSIDGLMVGEPLTLSGSRWVSDVAETSTGVAPEHSFAVAIFSSSHDIPTGTSKF